MATVLRLGVAIRGPGTGEGKAGEPHLAAPAMSPAQQPPREGCAQCPLGTQGSGQSLGRAGHGETQTEGLTCVAAAVSMQRPRPSAGRRGSREPLHCGQAASARSPDSSTAHAPCTSSFTRRGPFVSSELTATPSSPFDSKPPPPPEPAALPGGSGTFAEILGVSGERGRRRMSGPPVRVQDPLSSVPLGHR